MKLLRLNLKAVGPFSGVELDLAAGDHGLHLIYGPNEAGKSSALRALSYLLFGFPLRSSDDFVHPYNQLRVGATLRHSRGEELEILRRKANTNSLRGPDDVSVIPAEQWSRFLGGLEQASFETQFGIDHARLTRAGDELKSGQGQFGELLFAAAAGLAGLRQAQQSLQDRFETLFKPRGQNQRINKALSELRDALDELKQRQLPSEEWQRHQEALQEAVKQSEALQEQRLELSRDLHRLTRRRDAIPLVARCRWLREEIDRLGDVVRLRDDFGREARAALDALRFAERTIEQARGALVELEAELANTIPPGAVLDAAEEIEAIQPLLGAVEKAAQDRARLENFRSDTEHQARQLLRDLGRPPALDEAAALRLRADEPAIIRKLGRRHAQLHGQSEEARKTIARYESQIARHERDFAVLIVPPEITPLRRACRQAQKAGDLDARRAEARVNLAAAEKQAALELARIPGWSGSAEDLQQLAAPLDAALDRIESALLEARRDRQSLNDRRAEAVDSIRDLEARVQALQHEQDVPTEEALQAARNLRDEGWRLVRAAWLGGAEEEAQLAAFVAKVAPGRTLAEAYERCTQHADELADRLRREADRVGRKSEWIAQIERQRSACSDLDAEGCRLDECDARIQADWNALVGPLGIAVTTPAELRAWLRTREQVVLLIEKAQEARQAVERLDFERTTHRQALRHALSDLNEPPLPDESSLAEWLEHVGGAIERVDKAAQRREKLAQKLTDVRDELASARLSIETAEDELTRWLAEWSPWMRRLGLEPDADPEQAAVFLDKIQELDTVMHKHREHLSRMRGIDRDAADFRAAVAELWGRVATGVGPPPPGEAARTEARPPKTSADPALEPSPAAERARELARLLKDARAAEHRHTSLNQQRRAEAERLRTAEKERDEARITLERLCREAGCSDPDALVESERRSQARARLDDELRSCAEQLWAAAAGADVGSFTAVVEQTDPADLNSDIERLESEVAALDQRLGEVNQTIGSERNELARMDGQDDRAAEAGQKVQTILAQLQTDVARYATLKLLTAVLRRSIERYREKCQGPVIERASRLFAELTDGSFARLQIDDDDGRAVLKGVRADGSLVGVDGMSDGSHDQLYLAMRLASLESWLATHEPIPLVVDDILLNFDDRRATAALRALAELSRRTQVLFFTHHRHVIELAQAHLPADVVFVQELACLSTERDGPASLPQTLVTRP